MLRALLVLLTVAFIHAAPLTQEMLMSMRAGQRVDIVMTGGETWTGKLGKVSATKFEVQPEKRGAAVRTLSYGEVTEVRRKMTKTAKWTLVGVIWGGLTLLGAIVGG